MYIVDMALEIGNKFKTDYPMRSIIFVKKARHRLEKNFLMGPFKVDD